VVFFFNYYYYYYFFNLFFSRYHDKEEKQLAIPVALCGHRFRICRFSILVLPLYQIDKEGANPERVMQELSSVGLMPEDWGGDIPMVQVFIS
jgi:hypothetical protein